MIMYEPLSCRYLDTSKEEIYNVIEQFCNRKTKISANEFLTKFKSCGYKLGAIYVFDTYGWDDYNNLKNNVKVAYKNDICILELTVTRI